MSLTSPSFFVFAAIGLAVCWTLGPSTPRRAALVVLNLLFVASFMSSPGAALPLAAFLLIGYAATRIVSRDRSRALATVAIGAIVCAFAYLKQYSFTGFIEPLPFAYATIGLSYVLFRVLQLVIDLGAGDIEKPPSPGDYLGFVLFFPAFLAGPIQRWQDFERQGWRAPLPLSTAVVYDAFSRIITGLIKVALVSSAFLGLFSELSGPLLGTERIAVEIDARLLFAASCVLYTLYLYFNFAGYTDVVIGLARLFGVGLPENFNRPFAARNAIEFWSRWHMTLSDWFKTYLFNPLVTALVRRNPSAAAAPFFAVFGFFVTFLVMGIWHGSTPVFLFYGLFLGAGLALNKLYQIGMTRRLGRAGYQALARRPLYQQLCRGTNFAYFAVALTCFWVDTAQLQRLAAELGATGIAAAFLLVSVGAAVLTAATDRLAGLVERSLARLAAGPAALRETWLGGKAFALVTLSTLFNSPPDFVYQAF